MGLSPNRHPRWHLHRVLDDSPSGELGTFATLSDLRRATIELALDWASRLRNAREVTIGGDPVQLSTTVQQWPLLRGLWQYATLGWSEFPSPIVIGVIAFLRVHEDTLFYTLDCNMLTADGAAWPLKDCKELERRISGEFPS